MVATADLEVFLKPGSVAVIGATERPGSWGSFIMQGLLSVDYYGQIYAVNRNASKVFGMPAYKDVREIEGPVDLAVFTIPEEFVIEAIKACGEKGVKGITMVTAGFAETSEAGKEKQQDMARLARSHGMRVVGPNVSGTFNLHAKFVAAATPREQLKATELAATCQGGFAFYDLLSSASWLGMGVGKFIHTGNECDLTVTDFLEYYGQDSEVKGVVMYLETIRDGRRFIEVAREVTRTKPVVVYKGGRTPGSARAARSHTGALSGRKELFYGLLEQAGVTISPTMELMVPLGHFLIERPPMRGRKVAVVTMGGSWGVSLSDALEEEGLFLPELSQELQSKMRTYGIPERASLKNPIDIGASGMYNSIEIIVSLGRDLISSGEVDAMILHGVGRSGMLDEDSPEELRFFVEMEKEIIRGYQALEKEFGLPVIIGCHHTPWVSQVISDLNEEGIRVVDRLDEIAQLLSGMSDYWRYRGELG